MKNTNFLHKIAGVLMLVIGIFEIVRGIQLLQTGKTFQIDTPIQADINELRIAGGGMILIALLFLVSGIGVLMGRKSFVILSIVTIILYIADGILNSQLLFREALEIGTSIDLVLGLLLLTLLYLGRRLL